MMPIVETLNSDLDNIQVANSIICDIDDIDKHLINSNSKYNLNLLSQNIRSINCNMPNLNTFLHRSKVSWDILVLSECWLSSNRNIPSLDNYHYISTSSHNTQNEGVVIYYNKHLIVTHEEPCLSDTNCLLLSVNSDTCIIAIYRPPSQTNTSKFINSLDVLLTKLSSYKNIILCGDINIDISSNTTDKRAYDYLNLLAGHRILPGHIVPTHGRTCLDHAMIITNLKATCFIIESSITDHECVAVNLQQVTSSFNNSNKSYLVDFSGLDADLSSFNFNYISEFNDANLATDKFINSLSSFIIKNTRTFKTPLRQRIRKPWITKSLLRVMRNRDNLHKKLKRNPNNETLKVTYHRYRNFCNALLRKAKRNFEKQEVQKCKGNNKKIWDSIKSICNCKKTSIGNISLGSTNPVQSANDFNNFFANVGAELADKIISLNQNSHPVTDSYLYPSCSSSLDSLVLLPTDKEEIQNLINGLNNDSLSGVDFISGKIVKRYANLLIPPILHN
ncbi:unnamed protein product [Colias eurytheme]|nr:unnamed protein product [Colias eurytheme]